MAELISSPISQKKVCGYLEKNRNKYPFIVFKPSRKDENKSEDSFTYLRNTIAHSKQAGISYYPEVSKGFRINPAVDPTKIV